MKFTTFSTPVRYAETDQMKFVHHSNYLRYFEMARLEWLSSLGVSYAKMEQDGILMPVVRANVEYKTPLFFGDHFSVEVVLVKTPKATLEFNYILRNQKEELICQGNTVLAFLSPNTNRPMRCPESLVRLFDSEKA